MIVFDNILFQNVEELQKSDYGYIMWRVPESVRNGLDPLAANEVSRYSTGIELRFKMKDDSATLILQAEEALEAQVAYIYYGSIQGGWQNSSRVIGATPTRIEIKKPNNMEILHNITKEHHLPFSPEVVRIVLPYGNIHYIGVEGNIEVPTKEEMPEKMYLAYGSSITHGSLALASPYTYPFRVAEKLKADYINLGYAGSAHLEKAMAEYIVSRKDWDFATVELGVNMLREDPVRFEENLDVFTDILSKDGRPVLATSIFVLNDPKDIKTAERYRELVEKYTKGRLAFVDGLKLLSNPSYISQDMAHPSITGMEELSNKWYYHLSMLLNDKNE